MKNRNLEDINTIKIALCNLLSVKESCLKIPGTKIDECAGMIELSIKVRLTPAQMDRLLMSSEA